MDSPGQGRRKESLTSSITEGTSKFFSSMMAKKNGLMNDISSLSSKIETTFLPSTGVSSSESEGSIDTVTSKGVKHTQSGLKDSKPSKRKPPRPPPARQESIEAFMATQREKYGDSYKDIPFNTHISFDSPLYNGPALKSRELNKSESVSSDAVMYSETPHAEQSKESNLNNKDSILCEKLAKDVSSLYKDVDKLSKEPYNSEQINDPDKSVTGIKQAPDDYKKSILPQTRNENGHTTSQFSSTEDSDNKKVSNQDTIYNAHQTQLSSSQDFEFKHKKVLNNNHVGDTSNNQEQNANKRINVEKSINLSKKDTDEPLQNKTSPDNADDSSSSKPANYQMHRRRSSTVDEMLFDDYTEPNETPKPLSQEIPAVTKKLIAMGNLISFDDEFGVHHSSKTFRKNFSNKNEISENIQHNSAHTNSQNDRVLIPEKCRSNDNICEFLSSDESSEPEYGDAQVKRSASQNSERSWSSNFSTDSQPDVETRECMSFMKIYVEKIFNNE